MMNPMDCNPPDDMYCPHCGSKLPDQCIVAVSPVINELACLQCQTVTMLPESFVRRMQWDQIERLIKAGVRTPHEGQQSLFEEVSE